MEEEWKDVVGFEDYYMVSNFGRVLSKERYMNNHGAKVLKPEKIVSHYHTKCGYCQIDLSVDGKKYKRYVHRLVAEAFIPNPDNFPEVNHKDENKDNNLADNLEWCTRKYNQVYSFGMSENHCVDCGKVIGLHSNRCVFCNNKNLRKAYPDKENLLYDVKELGFSGAGRKYGVSNTTIKRWCKQYGLPYLKKDMEG